MWGFKHIFAGHRHGGKSAATFDEAIVVGVDEELGGRWTNIYEAGRQTGAGNCGEF